MFIQREKMKDVHGIILAAGYGTRLMPLTGFLPKPLMPVLGKPVILHQAELLKSAGIKKAVVNLHHLGDQIESFFKTRPVKGFNVTFSREEKILGTGGGVWNAWNHFNNRPVVVVNGDTLLDCELGKVIEAHLESGAIATMLLKPSATIPEENSIYVDGSGMVRRMVGTGDNPAGLQKCTFLGVHILHPDIIGYLPHDGCIIRGAYKKAIREGKIIRGFLSDATQRDVGTPEALLNVNLENNNYKNFFGPGCIIDDSVVTEGAILTGHNRVGTGAIINNSLVLDGETIRPGERIDRTIAGFGLRIKA